MAFNNRPINPADIDWDEITLSNNHLINDDILIKQIRYRDNIINREQHRPNKPIRTIINKLFSDIRYHYYNHAKSIPVKVDPQDLDQLINYIDQLESLLEKEQEQHCIDSPDLEF